MRKAAAVLTVFLAACTHATPAARAPRGSAPATTRNTVRAPSGAPRARMSSGTDSVEGVVVAWCEHARCQTDPTPRPKRYLPGDANGLLLFATSAAPAAARVEVRTPSGRVVTSGRVEAGTTMAFSARLPAGRYLVVLIAGWPDREARWGFGLVGPSG